MHYQVDQSGKIEQTSKPTVVAFSNKRQGSLLLLAKEKRKLQLFFRQAGKPKMFILQTFSALLYLLVKDILLIGIILVIDREYSGYENLIRNYLLQLVKKRSKFREFPKENIRFEEIGKRSAAHRIANRAFYHKRGVRIKAEEILKLTALLEH